MISVVCSFVLGIACLACAALMAAAGDWWVMALDVFGALACAAGIWREMANK